MFREPKNRASPDHPVVRQMFQRRDRLAQGLPSADGGTPASRLGLVLEGGGMRGVLGAGCLLALDELGFGAVFDEVYGESAGAINACYFLGGQTRLGSEIYTENLCCRRFYDPRRLNKILDLDYLVDHVMVRERRLDTAAVFGARSRLLVSVTSVTHGKSRMFDLQAERPPLLPLLKATAAAVPFYNRAVALGEDRYADGGIADPLPVMRAVERGCTHILVILTKPYGFVSRPFKPPTRLLLELYMRRWSHELRRALYLRYRRYNEMRAMAYGDLPPSRPVEIAVLCPEPEDPRVRMTTIDRGRLEQAREAGRRRTLAALVGEPLASPPQM